MTGSEFVRSFAERLGLEPPDQEQVERLLELASVAAHASERLAAPLACYLAGRANLDPARALETARALQSE